MEPVEVLKVGLLSIQVCALSKLSDDEIMRITNLIHPSGTTNGWCHIERERKGATPVDCEEHFDRTHYIIHC